MHLRCLRVKGFHASFAAPLINGCAGPMVGQRVYYDLLFPWDVNILLASVSPCSISSDPKYMMTPVGDGSKHQDGCHMASVLTCYSNVVA